MPSSFWHFFWQWTGWSIVGFAAGIIVAIPMIVIVIFCFRGSSTGTSLSIDRSVIAIAAAVAAGATIGWISAGFELRALIPLTGPIRWWQHLGAATGVLPATLLVANMANNGGVRDLPKTAMVSQLIGLLALVVTWMVLKRQFQSADIWLRISLGWWLTSLLIKLIPGTFGEQQPTSSLVSIGGSLITAYAFWALAHGVRQKTFLNPN
jgi:hypothetical protein